MVGYNLLRRGSNMKYEFQGVPLQEHHIQLFKELEESQYSGALFLEHKRHLSRWANQVFVCIDLKYQRKIIREVKKMREELNWYSFSEKSDLKDMIYSMRQLQSIAIEDRREEKESQNKESKSKESPKGQRSSSIVSKHEKEPAASEDEITTLLPIPPKHTKAQ